MEVFLFVEKKAVKAEWKLEKYTTKKKTIKVARRFQNVFPEPQWILCPRLALDDLGSGEAGNCFGALTHPKFGKTTMICEPNFDD